MSKSAAEIHASFPQDMKAPMFRGRVRDELFSQNMYIAAHDGYPHMTTLGLPPEEAEVLATEIGTFLMKAADPNTVVVIPDLDPEYPRGDY